MKRIIFRHKRNGERGSSLIEFALVGFLCVLVMLASFEFCRVLLVYTTVANAARAGCRYAITHGTDNPPAVSVGTVVTNFASTAPINTANLAITVTPDPPGAPGSSVSVKVVYPYDPFTLLPLKVRLGSISYGIVTY